MPVSDGIIYVKDYEQSYKPTLLYRFTFTNGVALAFSDAADLRGIHPDAINYYGVDYYSTVIRQRIQAIQATSQIGTDTFGSIGIDLADPAGVYIRYENTIGFAGALVDVKLVLYNPATGTCTPDSYFIFSGICDPATWANNALSITARSIYDLTRQTLPYMPVQRQCPKNFPATYSQRLDGAGNPFSIYYDCGYSPDIPGGVGNAGFTSCGYTRPDCHARGMFSQDSQGRNTSRFGADEWIPPATWKSKSYTQAKTIIGINNANPGKWGRWFPLSFGTAWISPVTMNGVGDANYSSWESACGYGDYNLPEGGIYGTGVQKVVVNGSNVPQYNQTSDLLFRWYASGTGSRNGYILPASTPIYEGGGDPHGSVLIIRPIVYQTVQNSASNPNIQVLTSRAVPVYTSPGQWHWERTSVLAWIVLEILRLSRPDLYAKIDIQSVIDYSYLCGGLVNYQRADGTPGQHMRYGAGLAIQDEVSVAQVIEGLKINGRLLIVPDQNGNIRFQAKQTVADQQWYSPLGSNDSAGYPSVHKEGGPATGYSAYTFDVSNIIENTARLTVDPIAQLPNVLTCSLTDSDNSFIPDSVSVADLDAFNRVGKKVPSTIQALGFLWADSCYRSARTRLAETWRANPTKNATGSYKFQFQTTVRAAHLKRGDICRISWPQWGLDPCWIRISGIAPTENYNRVTISANYHVDDFYTDAYGAQ